MQTQTVKYLGITVLAVILFSTTAFFAGKYVGERNSAQSELGQLVQKLNPGDSITIDEESVETGEVSTSTGVKVDIKNKEDYSRIMSFFGLGGPEAAAKSQGIGKISEGGEDVASTGVHKGYGILEQAWVWIKDFFWVAVLIVGALLIMLLIPQTAPFAAAILHGLASLVPILGSIVTGLIGYFKTAVPLQQVVDGTEAFKTNLTAYDMTGHLSGKNFADPATGATSALNVAADIKADVIKIFNDSQNKAQDSSTQAKVASLQ
jgi:hypothetical protein